MANGMAALRLAVDEIYSTQVTTPQFREQYANFRKSYDTPPNTDWYKVVVERLCAITTLTPNWNGYDDVPVRYDTAFFALKVLNELRQPRTPVPQVVPTSVGGVQFEWHEKGIDLEMHFASPYECEVWFNDQQTNQQLSVNLTSEFSSLRTPISILSRR